jgi:hypothetical protein
MSGSRLVRSSPDLTRLVDEGYSIRLVNGYLAVDDVPFVDDSGKVGLGALLCPLDLQGDRTAKPSTHVMCFVGGEPRDRNGQPIDGLINAGVERWSASPDLVATCGFSQKPRPDGYSDYYEKVSYYVAMVANHAHAVAPGISALTAKPVATDEDDGVFVYVDTFSSRAGITARNEHLAIRKVVVVGLGGTGGYLLDLLAKTPIHEIHLYDGDIFGTHNAFRAPGAAGLEDLRAGQMKVDYFARTYARMHRGIRPHAARVTAGNVHELLDADFVFLAMDSNPDKKTIVEALLDACVPFVDAGIGVSNDPNGIAGQIRVTTSTPGRSDHIDGDQLLSYAVDGDAEYDTNLQVAELNMMAAGLAVVRFKKLFEFYADDENERHSVYVIGSNEIHSRYGQDGQTTAALSVNSTDGREPEAAA